MCFICYWSYRLILLIMTVARALRLILTVLTRDIDWPWWLLTTDGMLLLRWPRRAVSFLCYWHLSVITLTLRTGVFPLQLTFLTHHVDLRSGTFPVLRWVVYFHQRLKLVVLFLMTSIFISCWRYSFVVSIFIVPRNSGTWIWTPTSSLQSPGTAH